MNAQPHSAPKLPVLDEFETDFLLYLESRLVEHSGRLRSDQMRPEELQLAQRWHASGFLNFSPMRTEEVDYTQSHPETHRVSFSETAWALAWSARRAKAVQSRMFPGPFGVTH